MRTIALIATGAGALMLASCADKAETMPTPAPNGACNADPGQAFVGQTAEQGTVEKARRATGSGTVRVVRQGQPVTMDYRADRLNIEVDGNQVILSVRCG